MTLEAKIITALLAIALGSYLAVLNYPRPNTAYPTIQINYIIIGDKTMPFAIESLLGPIGGVIGGALEQQGARQQYDWQHKLMQSQELAAQRMGQFNKQMALDLWKETNYPQQVEQMRKAGLNVGLMYKGAGPGGSTNVSPGQMPSTSGAPRANLGMALQMGLQSAMTAAQIENVKADTALKQTQAGQSKAQTEYTGAQTVSEGLRQQYQTFQNTLAEIQTKKEGATLPDQINSIKAAAIRMYNETRSAAAKANVDEASQQNAISKADSEATAAALEVYLKQANIIQTGQQTEAIKANIAKIGEEITNMKEIRNIRWGELSVSERELAVKALMANLQEKQIAFNTSTPQQARQWLEALMGGANLANSIKTMRK